MLELAVHFDINIFVNVTIAAAVGTTVVEVIFKPISSGFVNYIFYILKLNFKSKMELRGKLVELITTVGDHELGVVNSKEFNQAKALYDKLRTKGDNKTADIFWEYVLSVVNFNAASVNLRYTEEADKSLIINTFNECLVEKTALHKKLITKLSK